MEPAGICPAKETFGLVECLDHGMCALNPTIGSDEARGLRSTCRANLTASGPRRRQTSNAAESTAQRSELAVVYGSGFYGYHAVQCPGSPVRQLSGRGIVRERPTPLPHGAVRPDLHGNPRSRSQP